jgi:acetyltransferase-like isoleucine patch superfamily enzyme
VSNCYGLPSEMLRLQKTMTALAALLLPSMLAIWILRLLGHAIGPGCRIGVSWLWVDRLFLQGKNRIGHANVVVCRRLCMRRDSYVGRANRIRGPFSILLCDQGAIGNANTVVRGPEGSVSTGPAMLLVGRLSKITVEHRIDLTRSVRIGDFSILAGSGTQVWTHGYVHDLTGPGRYRIDGRVRIASNVYVGSGSILSAGIVLGQGVMVGAGTAVGRSLTEPGLYVSSPMRCLPRPDAPELRADLERDTAPDLCETVYVKVGSQT